ncbi:MAG TPA: hypothetical protein VHD32_11775 [Candidatus Didemnitutus sp.]|nr:hypothetical protein [Candidatus Didemnitutus sp.]
MTPLPVTLQISLAPSDHRLAEHILPHQIRQWQDAVAEILVTIDLQRSHGRFGADWEAGKERILALTRRCAPARVLAVDYDAPAQRRVAAEFFAGATIPAKDCRGGPYYSYFFGLGAATHDFVLHADADILFGGKPAEWLREALALHESDSDLLVTAPLPGPPSADGSLRQLKGVRGEGPILSYRFEEMSSRVFLMSRARFRNRVGSLRPQLPSWRAMVRAAIDGNPVTELPEVLFTRAMKRHGLHRIDTLGALPGCWSLHPPYRNEEFLAKLPELIRRVETDDLPAGQRGDHDINDSLVDWSDARRALAHRRWWRRLFHRASARA